MITLKYVKRLFNLLKDCAKANNNFLSFRSIKHYMVKRYVKYLMFLTKKYVRINQLSFGQFYKKFKHQVFIGRQNSAQIIWSEYFVYEGTFW